VPYDSATPDDLAQTAKEVEATGRRVLTHQGDVRDLEDMTAFVAAGVAAFGRLDVVVANAGICIPATWDETTPQVFQDTLDINVTGVWNTVMASAPHLIEGGAGGSIVLTSSYAGKKMQPFMIHYTTSKHAVTGMTRAFAAELGKHGIRVNSVHPGAVGTPMGSGDMVGAIERTNAANPKLALMGTTFIDPPYAEATRSPTPSPSWRPTRPGSSRPSTCRSTAARSTSERSAAQAREAVGDLVEGEVQLAAERRPLVGQPGLERRRRGGPRGRRDEPRHEVGRRGAGPRRHVPGDRAVDLGEAQLGVGQEGRLGEDQVHPLAQQR